MAITKTKFVEYTRCDRYVFLEDIRREFLQNPISYQEYKEQEEAMQLQEIRDAMFEGSTGDYQDKTIQEINNFVCVFMRETERRDNKNDKTQRQYQ